MVDEGELKKYWSALPESMGWKKKVIKIIMTSKEPLSQTEILSLMDSNDWTNVKRVLRDLLDEGLIVEKLIGTKTYYMKVDVHRKGKQFVDGGNVYFIDLFESDVDNGEQYIRVKQTEQLDKTTFKAIGKITIKLSKLKDLISELESIKL